MYGYVYMAMFVLLYIHGYVYMVMYRWLCMYVCASMPMCVCMYGCACIAMSVWLCIHAYAYMAMYAWLFAYMHVCSLINQLFQKNAHLELSTFFANL